MQQSSVVISATYFVLKLGKLYYTVLPIPHDIKLGEPMPNSAGEVHLGDQ